MELETTVHPLNPRNQEALSVNAVRDILKDIEARGVDTEGVAVKRNGVYLLIEGSRSVSVAFNQQKNCHYGFCLMMLTQMILIPSYQQHKLLDAFHIVK